MALIGPTPATADVASHISPTSARPGSPEVQDGPPVADNDAPMYLADVQNFPMVPCVLASPVKQEHLHNTTDESTLHRCVWRKYNMDKFLLQNSCNFKYVPSDQKPHVLVHREGGQDKFNFTTNSKASILYFQIITHLFGNDFPIFPSLLTCQIKGERSCLNSRCPYGIIGSTCKSITKGIICVEPEHYKVNVRVLLEHAFFSLLSPSFSHVLTRKPGLEHSLRQLQQRLQFLPPDDWMSASIAPCPPLPPPPPDLVERLPAGHTVEEDAILQELKQLVLVSQLATKSELDQMVIVRQRPRKQMLSRPRHSSSHEPGPGYGHGHGHGGRSLRESTKRSRRNSGDSDGEEEEDFHGYGYGGHSSGSPSPENYPSARYGSPDGPAYGPHGPPQAAVEPSTIATAVTTADGVPTVVLSGPMPEPQTGGNSARRPRPRIGPIFLGPAPTPTEVAALTSAHTATATATTPPTTTTAGAGAGAGAGAATTGAEKAPHGWSAAGYTSTVAHRPSHPRRRTAGEADPPTGGDPAASGFSSFTIKLGNPNGQRQRQQQHQRSRTWTSPPPPATLTPYDLYTPAVRPLGVAPGQISVVVSSSSMPHNTMMAHGMRQSPYSHPQVSLVSLPATAPSFSTFSVPSNAGSSSTTTTYVPNATTSSTTPRAAPTQVAATMVTVDGVPMRLTHALPSNVPTVLATIPAPPPLRGRPRNNVHPGPTVLPTATAPLPVLHTGQLPANVVFATASGHPMMQGTPMHIISHTPGHTALPPGAVLVQSLAPNIAPAPASTHSALAPAPAPVPAPVSAAAPAVGAQPDLECAQALTLLCSVPDQNGGGPQYTTVLPSYYQPSNTAAPLNLTAGAPPRPLYSTAATPAPALGAVSYVTAPSVTPVANINVLPPVANGALAHVSDTRIVQPSFTSAPPALAVAAHAPASAHTPIPTLTPLPTSTPTPVPAPASAPAPRRSAFVKPNSEPAPAVLAPAAPNQGGTFYLPNNTPIQLSNLHVPHGQPMTFYVIQSPQQTVARAVEHPQFATYDMSQPLVVMAAPMLHSAQPPSASG